MNIENAKPILFNTEMVRAILDGRKTVTRRVVKNAPTQVDLKPYNADGMYGIISSNARVYPFRPPYQIGDILYVRETWERLIGHYIYRVDQKPGMKNSGKWRPSIHMPKEAARIFLRVTDVHVERLQDIQERGKYSAQQEGFINDIDLNSGTGKSAKRQFSDLWDSTIKPADRDRYGWDANPWVWVIEFERISKEESIK